MSNYIDLTGQRFGRLTVIKYLRTDKNYAPIWLCKCDCGNTCEARSNKLRQGLKVSCGCYKHNHPIDTYTKDITGQKFNRLTAVKLVGIDKGHHALWECECDCGNRRTVSISDLKNGYVKSCGCQKKEKISELKTTHGEGKTKLYRVWSMMKDRCINPNDTSYERYGGRGIKVCDEWMNSYVAFRDWAYQNGYNECLSIERIDNNGNYEPSNCKWATVIEQSRNRRSNIIIEINGQKKIVVEWAEIYNISPQTIYKRLKRGWNEIEAVTTPVLQHFRNSRYKEK